MGTINERIVDAQIRHMIWLERFKTGEVYKIIALLNRSDDDLMAQITARLTKIEKRGMDTGPETTKRLQKMLDEIRDQRISLYSELSEEGRNSLNEFAIHEVDFQKSLIENAVSYAGGSIAMERPSLSQLRAAVNARPFQGRLLKDWYSDLAESSSKRISDAVRIGITQGQTTDQIVRRIRGTRAAQFQDGILEISRREAAAVVRTAVAHVANYAAEDLYAANSDIVKGVQMVATLDGKTSAYCRAIDGKVYPIKKGPRPPFHFQCRTRGVPYLGATSIVGTRASITGQVPDNLTYQDWLKKQPVTVQNEILGPARAKLFRDGNMTLDRFVDPNGRQYSLEQLKKRDADIFDDTFGGNVKKGAAEQLKRESDFKDWLGQDKYKAALREANSVADIGHVRELDLSEAELVAINAYTGTYYRTLNGALRSGDAISAARVEPFRSMLNAALDKMPVYEGLTKRGAYLDATAMSGLEVGKVLKEQAFLSTSYGDGAFDGNVRYVIYSKNGKNIERLSSFSSEQEVLFKAGTEFEIIDVIEDDGVLTVTMKEL